MWVEGTLGIVPQLAPKIMLNEEGENITLSDNKAMFTKWANSESSVFLYCYSSSQSYSYLTSKSPDLLIIFIRVEGRGTIQIHQSNPQLRSYQPHSSTPGP